MGCISTVDLQTKMEVQELVSRFCHFLDHNNPVEWSRLFTANCHVDAGPAGIFDGRGAIAAIPDYVYLKSDGNWRHHLSNIMIDRTGNARELDLRAYCLVTDWSKKGALIACFDFHARLQNRCHWQIADLCMRPVGAGDGKSYDRASAEKIAAGMMLN